MRKPIGTFKCTKCKKIWDGSEVLGRPPHENVWFCHNLLCEAVVIKISDKPKKEHECCNNLQKKKTIKG